MKKREAEERAVAAVKAVLLNCPRLDSHLNTADSGPLTDGHIDFHSREDDSIETLSARVLVQIKGRSAEPGGKPRTSFSFERAHLQGYLSLRGVLFFVVDIDKLTKTPTTYYAILSPLKLENHLKSARDDQRHISVKVTPVPTDPQALENLVELTHRKADERPGSVADVSVLGQVDRFRIHTDGSISFDGQGPVDLDPERHDFLVTAVTEFGEQVIDQTPIRFIPEDYVVGKPVDVPISAGDVVVEQPIRKRIDGETVSLELNDGLCILLKRPVDGSQVVSMQFETSRFLQSRLQSLEFVLATLDHQGFWLGNTFVQLHGETLKDEAELRAQRGYLRRLAAVFDFIGADTRIIDLDEMEDKQYKQLLDLHDPLVKRVEVKADLPRPGRILQRVGRWWIELICFEGSELGSFKVRHLFDPELMMHFAASVETEGGAKRHLVTPYDAFVDEERFPYTLNLRLDGIVDYYRKISEYTEISGFATRSVLRLVNASDQVPERQKEFLDAAIALNDWLIEQSGEQGPYMINRSQMIARRRALTSEERDRLRAIKRAGDPDELTRDLIAYSCSVLLEDLEEAEFIFSQLRPETQDMVKAWPIWGLHTSKGRQPK